MARLRQQYPQNYGSSGNINTEFESVVRYLNAAELGEKTVGELLATIFDGEGKWIGPVEFRKDSSAGLQYRIGTYSDASTGWVTLVTNADLRGQQGIDFGEIGAPIIHSRSDLTATSGQTVFDYAHVSTDELLVFKNGVLLRPGGGYDYTTSTTTGSASAGAVTFNSAVTTGHVVTMYKIRATSVTGFNRSDTLTTASQTVFAFVFDESTKLQVYKNGILMREGGSYDYTIQSLNNTVTFNSAVASGNLVTIVSVENTSTTAATGMMFEENYVQTASGLIDFAKITVADAAITQAKVSGLVTGLGGKANLAVSASTPSSPGQGDLWHDTSQTPNVLKFWDGTQWIQTSTESTLPTFVTGNAGQYVRVNAAGQALEYASLDLTSKISVSEKGAANGVATLDSSGKLPSAQLPSVLSTDCMYLKVASPSAANYVIKKVYGQKIQITGIYAATTGGTVTIQPLLGGSAWSGSSTYSAVGTSGSTNALSQANYLEADCNSIARDIGFIVTSPSSSPAAANLEVVFSYNILGS